MLARTPLSSFRGTPGAGGARARLVVARVSSIPTRPVPAGDEEAWDGAAAASAERGVLAADAGASALAERGALADRLSLNVAHTCAVEAGALPADHPDHEPGAAAASAALLIPADHPDLEISEQQAQEQQQAAPAAQRQHHQPQRQHKQHPQQRRRAGGQGGAGRVPAHPRNGELLSPAFAVGDMVWGEVVHNAGTGGARVRLLQHEGVIG